MPTCSKCGFELRTPPPSPPTCPRCGNRLLAAPVSGPPPAPPMHQHGRKPGTTLYGLPQRPEGDEFGSGAYDQLPVVHEIDEKDLDAHDFDLPELEEPDLD